MSGRIFAASPIDGGAKMNPSNTVSALSRREMLSAIVALPALPTSSCVRTVEAALGHDLRGATAVLVRRILMD